MATGHGQSGSTLMLDEYYSAGDDRFVDELRGVHSPKKLAALVERWKNDPRPWARRMLLEYLDRPLDAPGHEVLVKRLFKHYESAGDDEMMAAFLVAFDRLVRRVRKKRYDYDYRSRTVTEREELRTPRNTIPRNRQRQARDPWTGKTITVPVPIPRNGRLFSYRTRYYLRRRAWRYFRRLGYSRPLDYGDAAARFLARYTDDDLAAGENLLDSWGLMNACFRRSEVLAFSAHRVTLRPGKTLADLVSAPRFPALWMREGAIGTLLDLLAGNPEQRRESARSRTVRQWAMMQLREHHGDALAAAVTPEDLVRLLGSANAEVAEFGAELLAQVAESATWDLATWLRMLDTTSPAAQVAVCDAMVAHVTPDRLTLAQCVELACRRPAPVARMALEFLRQRTIATEDDRRLVARIADAKCNALARELAEWALSIVGQSGVYDRDAVCGFFDALAGETRDAAWAWLTPESPGWNDPGLWARLTETPHDDLKLRLIETLDRRANLPGVGGDALQPLWIATLLNVHRGGRAKRRAAHQVADAIARDPDQADRLLPVLAVAVRSIREPEQRAGLAAAVGLIERDRALAGKVLAALGELTLIDPQEPAE